MLTEPYPHASPDVLLPPDARADRARARLHRAAAALQIKRGKQETYVKDEAELDQLLLTSALAMPRCT